VSVERARKDYGVIVRELDPELDEYEVDRAATTREREHIRAERSAWLEEGPAHIANRYREGELDVSDLIRQYGVIVDWGTGELLPRTTTMFRAMLRRRAAGHWVPAREPAAVS